jgi:hypothetical protein
MILPERVLGRPSAKADLVGLGQRAHFVRHVRRELVFLSESSGFRPCWL